MCVTLYTRFIVPKYVYEEETNIDALKAYLRRRSHSDNYDIALYGHRLIHSSTAVGKQD